MSHFKQSKTVHRVVSTVSSGGTLTLVNNSARYQQITGTQNHTIVLPDATTLPKGIAFIISNRGSGIVTVNYNGGSLAKSLAANTQATLIVFDNVTSLGDWDVSNEASSGGGASLTSGDKLSALAGIADGNYQDSENTVTKFQYNIQESGSDSWLARNTLATSKGVGASFVIHGLLYGTGGLTAAGFTPSNTTERYDLDNNYWLVRAVLPASLSNVNGFPYNGFGYTVGGQTAVGVGNIVTSVYKYDDSANTWSSSVALSAALQETASFVLNLPQIAGGYNSAGSLVSSSQIFNDSAGAWYFRTSMANARTGAGGGALNKFGYIVGGADGEGGNVNTNNERFSEENNTWLTLAPITSGKAYYDLSDMNGSLYAAAGAANGFAGTSSVYKYSDINNVWATKASLTSGTRAGPLSKSIFGSTITFGGNDGANFTTTSAKYSDTDFSNLNIFKKSKLIPSALFVGSFLNDLAASSPVRIRTDGNQWRYLESNKDSSLKLNETLKTKFIESQLYYIAAGNDGGGNGLSGNEFYNDDQNVWSTRTSLGTARAAPSSFRAEGFGYTVAGASNTTPSNSIATSERFDDILNTSTAKASITTARIYSFGINLLGLGYVMGGWDTSTSYLTSGYKYTPSNNAWTAIASLSSGRIESGTAALHDQAYAIGGYIGGPITTHERYNPITDSWQGRTSVPVAVGAPCAFTLGEKYYMAGGFNGGALTTVREYDDQADSFTSKTSLSTSRYGAGPGSLHGFGYVSAGNGGGTSTEKYNNAANTWSTVGTLSVARDYPSWHGAGIYRSYEIQLGLPAYIAGAGGGVWVTKASLNENRQGTEGFSLGNVGYVCGNFRSGVSLSATCEAYDRVSNAWIYTASLPASTGYCGQGSLEGFGYIQGGEDNVADSAFRNSNYQFNQSTVSWATKTVMPTARRTPASFVLNGYIYQVTGFTGSNTAVNEQYNPATDAWATKTSAGTARRNCSGTQAIGFGYTVAGGSPTGTTVERYNDVSNAWTSMSAYPISDGNLAIGISFAGRPISHTSSSTAYEYNPLSDTYALRSTPPNNHGSGMAFTVSSGLFFAGGGSTVLTTQYIETLNNILVGAGLRVTES